MLLRRTKSHFFLLSPPPRINCSNWLIHTRDIKGWKLLACANTQCVVGRWAQINNMKVDKRDKTKQLKIKWKEGIDMCYSVQCWNLWNVITLDLSNFGNWHSNVNYKILWLFKSLMVYVWLINEMHFSQGIYCILCLELGTFCVVISLIFASISPLFGNIYSFRSLHPLFQWLLPLCTLEMEPDCLCVIATGWYHCFNFVS